jgi:F-type H+-transporting ATPase subunit b
MLIDWFTVAAQIVNFLVLVWLLKRFLYGRIIRAIDAREKKIAAGLVEAAAKKEEADERLTVYQAKLSDFEKQHEAMLADAKLDAGRLRTEMIEEARAQVRSLETKWQEDLDRERNAFLAALRSRAATEILAIAQRVVGDLAGWNVQQCAVQVFLEKLRLLDKEEWKNFAQGDLLLRSAFDVPEDTRVQIRQTIEEKVEMPISVRFERASGMGLGVELRGNGRRIGWNSKSYLEALEEDLKKALKHSPEHAHAEVT